MFQWWFISIVIAGLIVWIAYHIYLAVKMVGKEREE